MSSHFKFIPALFLFLGLSAQTPTATIVVPSGTLCTGTSHTFSFVTSPPSASSNYTIFPSTSVSSTLNTSNQSLDLNFGMGGVYTLSLQVSDGSGSSIVTKTVGVSQSAKASFNASLNTVGFPNQMILTNYSSYSSSNAWLFSDDPLVDGSVSTVKNYTASGSYSVSLISFGANGCNDTLDYFFRIEDSSGVTLPNIFTPNNDSINDIFKPITRGIKTLNVWIYNRYGTLIHSWDKVQGFWDGYTTSGSPCQDGTYFCILEATGFDGRSYKLKSNVTLVR